MKLVNWAKYTSLAFWPWLDLSGPLGGVLLLLRRFSCLSSLGSPHDPDDLPGSRDLLGNAEALDVGPVVSVGGAGAGVSVVGADGGNNEALQSGSLMSVSLEDDEEDEDDEDDVRRAAP